MILLMVYDPSETSQATFRSVSYGYAHIAPCFSLDAMWIHRIGPFFVVVVVAILLRTVLVPVLEHAFRSQSPPSVSLAYPPTLEQHHQFPFPHQAT